MGWVSEATSVLMIVPCRNGEHCLTAAGRGTQQQKWGAHGEQCLAAGKKGWVARSRSSSSPESNYISSFPQTYVFTDEEDDALKRRMGNDMSCNTTPLQHPNCHDLGTGSGVKASSPMPALLLEAHPSPCPVGGPQAAAVMIWFSWLIQRYTANWRQEAVCLKASMGGSSP